MPRAMPPRTAIHPEPKAKAASPPQKSDSSMATRRYPGLLPCSFVGFFVEIRLIILYSPKFSRPCPVRFRRIEGPAGLCRPAGLPRIFLTSEILVSSRCRYQLPRRRCHRRAGQLATSMRRRPDREQNIPGIKVRPAGPARGRHQRQHKIFSLAEGTNSSILPLPTVLLSKARRAFYLAVLLSQLAKPVRTQIRLQMPVTPHRFVEK